jgi:hypothetical protein
MGFQDQSARFLHEKDDHPDYAKLVMLQSCLTVGGEIPCRRHFPHEKYLYPNKRCITRLPPVFAPIERIARNAAQGQETTVHGAG